jgi:menaquinone-specific isochorismate synthase
MLDLPSNLVNTIQESVENQLEKTSLKDFISSGIQKASQEGHSIYLAFSFPFEKIDPLTILEILTIDNSFRYYWERKDLQLSLSGAGSIISLSGSGDNRFKDISNQCKDITEKTLVYKGCDHTLAGINFLGGFSFFDAMESSNWQDFGSANFVVPEWLYIQHKNENILTLTIQISPEETYDSAFSTLKGKLDEISEKMINSISSGTAHKKISYEVIEKPGAYQHWKESVKKATDLISNKEFEKIVLAREIEVKTDRPISTTRLLHHLREQYETSYCFLLQYNNDSAFIGCSPERLASFQANFVLAEGLAGSISRGESSDEDANFAEKLLKSAKNREEHQYVVKAIEDHLKQFTEQIDYPEIPVIKKFVNVQHLYTPITAWMNTKVDPLAVLEQLHPTPAVGGAPRVKALPWIKKLENFDRGWYAGPVGWYNPDGRGEFCVGIRSGLVQSNRARFYAGCGIVADSKPHMEWEETNLKLIPMLSAVKNA